MSYLWAGVVIVMACKIGWSLHDLYADWQRRRHAKWVTVRLTNGVVLTARVDDIDWCKFFDVDERA